MSHGSAYRFNPYTTPVDRWTDDKLAARRSMPTNGHGHIVQPKYMQREADVRAHTERWRVWARDWEPHLWPVWLAGWLEANPT